MHRSNWAIRSSKGALSPLMSLSVKSLRATVELSGECGNSRVRSASTSCWQYCSSMKSCSCSCYSTASSSQISYMATLLFPTPSCTSKQDRLAKMPLTLVYYCVVTCFDEKGVSFLLMLMSGLMSLKDGCSWLTIFPIDFRERGCGLFWAKEKKSLEVETIGCSRQFTRSLMRVCESFGRHCLSSSQRASTCRCWSLSSVSRQPTWLNSSSFSSSSNRIIALAFSNALSLSLPCSTSSSMPSSPALSP